MTVASGSRTDTLASDAALSDEPGQDELFAAIAAAHASEADMRRRPQALLDAIAGAIGATTAHLSLTLGGDEFLIRSSDAAADEWDGTVRSSALESHADATPRARVYGRTGGKAEFVLLTAPLAKAGRDPFGGIALLRPIEHADDAERMLLMLRAAASHASLALTSAAPTRHPGADLDDFSRVFAKAPEYKSTAQFAYAITNTLRARFDCEQTALGLVERGQVKIACISGLDHVKRRSPGAHQIEQAMGETADAGLPLSAQAADQWGDRSDSPASPLHQRWRANAAGASVASVPLMAGDVVVAVLSMRRAEDRPFSPDDLAAAAQLVRPLASALPLIAESTRSVHSRAVRQASDTLQWAVRPGSWGRKVLLGLMLVLGIWFAAGTSMYRVAAPATVVATREHTVATPFDGKVAEVMVRPGDSVIPGQPLARMDVSPLELERTQLLAQRRQLDLRVQDATSQRDTAAAAVASAERSVIESRLATLADRIDRAVIVAESSGIVVGSETRELSGAFVGPGEPLFVIADETSLVLELRVPEGRIAHISPGSSVRFASNARPEIIGHSVIERVAPSAGEDERSGAFAAHAPVPAEQEWLRPGMEGVAQIETGRRRNWWIALHGVLDAARLRFWID